MVSFLTDLSSEMIYPLLPIFVSTVLGGGVIALGLIEGVAESTAALLKVFSGIWTDRSSRRKPLILAGYGLAGSVRPLIGLAASWPAVILIRFLDRVGKGLRTSPRDAMIADAADPKLRGTAFGFHRSMDHAGAVVGPLIAAGLLSLAGFSLRTVFLLSAVPAVLTILLLAVGVKEGAAAGAPVAHPAAIAGLWRSLGSDFKWLLAALLVFTLGNASDAFILLRLSAAGVPTPWVAGLWSAHHIIKLLATYSGGRLSDRLGRRRMVLTGWFLYSLIYFGFGFAQTRSSLVLLFLAYGVYFGLTEPTERAWVTDLAPPEGRGTAFGFYHGVIGLASLPASLIFGFVWQAFGSRIAFLCGAGLAFLGALLLLGVGKAGQPHSSTQPA